VEEYPFKVKYHEKYVKWYSKLKDERARARISAQVKRIREFGDFGDCEFFDNDVWEFRVHYGPGYRVYYTRVDDKVVLLLCGGKKSSQKRDIKRAMKLAKEVKSEKED